MMVWASSTVVRSEPNDEATNLFLRPGRRPRGRLRCDRRWRRDLPMQCAVSLHLGRFAGDQAGTERGTQGPEAGPEGARRGRVGVRDDRGAGTMGKPPRTRYGRVIVVLATSR